LQGVVLVGLGRAAVVADAVPFDRGEEVGSPAMAVRSSVVEDDEKREEAVAEAFCAPEMTMPGALDGRIGILVDTRSLD
jgi:hypothetical protein